MKDIAEMARVLKLPLVIAAVGMVFMFALALLA